MLSSVLLFLNIGAGEMVMIIGAALLLFGGEKLPEIARGLGKGIRDFKDASEDVKREINNQINNYEPKKTETKKLTEETESAETEEEAKPLYTPVAGTVAAYGGYSASDSIDEEVKDVKDDTELGNPEAPETYSYEPEDTELQHPVTGKLRSNINLTKADDEPEKKTIEEEYK